jgi:CubicO group peptidase (beta-lactamase class C family)
MRLLQVCLLFFVVGTPFAGRTQVPVPAVRPAAPAPAQTRAAVPVSTAPAPAHALTSADLEAFFDGMFPLQLERSDVAGASVLVMQNGNVLLQKGYGFADMKTKKPVDPATTIFRLASISKLFTWISIMQLEEQGKVNLDADVNQYLDFAIRPAFGRPITLRNLMTHTGGFEEMSDDILLTDPKKAPTLRDDLIANQPMRIFPPGQIPAYSNYGVGLASYIVQRVSGEPFPQYVQEHIFAPLKMTNSSFDQPVAKPLATAVSEGYRGDTTKPPVGFEIFSPVGAGGVSSSAADMGRFGQALLNGGELDGQHILKPETLAEMWTPQFQANPELPPICMGFYEDWRNSLRWIGHEGDLIAFHSLFFVEPQQKLVLFVSYNSAGGGGKPRPEIIDNFSDRYFPGAPPVKYPQNWPAEMRGIVGQYETTRRADSTKWRLLTLGGQATAAVSRDGELTITGFKDLRGHIIKWKPVARDLWQAEGDQQRLYAIRDANDRVVRLAFDFPGVQMQRAPWYADNRWLSPSLGTAYGILVLVLAATLIRIGRRMILRKRPRLAPQPGTLWLTCGPRAAAILWVVFLGTVFGYFAARGSDALPPTPAWYPWLEAMNWATGVCLFFSFFALLAGIRIWRREETRWITKVKFSLVGAACTLLSVYAVYFHLIGPAHRI